MKFVVLFDMMENRQNFLDLNHTIHSHKESVLFLKALLFLRVIIISNQIVVQILFLSVHNQINIPDQNNHIKETKLFVFYPYV